MKTINDIKNAVLSGNRVFWKNDSYEVIKDSKNQWMIAFRQGQSGENYVGLTYRDGVKSDYNPKDFYIKGKSVNMKVEDNFYGKRVVKGIFAKAKFAKEYILWAVPKGKTDTMYSQPIAEQLYTDAQINDVKRRATAAGWHTFRIAEMMSFEDMTNAFKGKPVKRRSSRTGSKARFADDGRAKALVILQQLGGNMFVAMTGAKNLSTESNPPALSMKVGSGAQNKVKHLKVVLDEGSDTYTMIFFDSKGSTIKKLDHVYAEDLRRIFTEVTGFYTSLTRHSRQGSKAKMASQLRKQQPYEVLYYKWFAGVQVNIMDMGKIKNEINAIIASGANPEIEMPKLVKKYGSFSRTGYKAKFAANQKAKFEIVKSGGQTFRIDHFDGDDFKLYMRIDGEFTFIKKLENPMSWIRAHAQPGDPDNWLPWAIKNSRTGAKAKFAVVGDIVKVRQGHKSVKGEIVKDNGDGTYMIELPNQLYSDGRKIIERVSEARLLLSRTGAKVFK